MKINFTDFTGTFTQGLICTQVRAQAPKRDSKNMVQARNNFAVLRAEFPQIMKHFERVERWPAWKSKVDAS